MERAIFDSIYSFLNLHDLLSPSQHGFVRGSSTVSNLLESVTDWMHSIDSGNNIDVIYIDLRKAFDSVVYSKLSDKMLSIGIQGNLIGWLMNYLTGRKQSTLVETSRSSLVDVRSGVPQGSVLGPLLFNIFANDLPQYLMTTHSLPLSPVKLFADDVKMYRIVNCLNDAVYFQSLINSINSWCTESLLTINAEKCFIMHLGKTNPHFAYGLNSTKLPTTSLIKDLGVVFDPSLTFSKQIAASCSKARARCALYFKTFISRDIASMKLFFTAYIRPLLEFSSPVWSPLCHFQINALESVQRYFTNRIPTCTFLPYKQRLNILALDSLQKRRLIADLVFVYSVVTGLYNTCLNPFLNFEPPLNTRSHNLRLSRPHLNLSSTQQNLISRVAPIWNKLPSSVLESSSKFVFRRRVTVFCNDPYFMPRH